MHKDISSLIDLIPHYQKDTTFFPSCLYLASEQMSVYEVDSDEF